MQNKLPELNNTSRFLKEAAKLRANGIPINRSDYSYAQSIFEFCKSEAELYLGEDAKYVIEDIENPNCRSVRWLIKSVFGLEGLAVFQDNTGRGFFDKDRALVLYYKVNGDTEYVKRLLASDEGEKLTRNSLLRIATGLIYFFSASHLKSEIASMRAVTVRGVIQPSYVLTTDTFHWGRCPVILEKTSELFIGKEGYTHYVYEKPDLFHIAYLMNGGMSHKEAVDYLSNHDKNTGLFISYLPRCIESMLYDKILAKGFKSSVLNGIFGASLVAENMALLTDNTCYNLTASMLKTLKPIMMEFMGVVLSALDDELTSNDLIDISDVEVSNVSLNRISILVKEGVDIAHALPNLHTRFKKVPGVQDNYYATKPLDAEDILNEIPRDGVTTKRVLTRDTVSFNRLVRGSYA